MNSKHFLVSLVVIMSALTAADGYADEQRVKFSLDAAAGVEQDSNVALVELDNSSGEADTATVLSGGLNMKLATSKQTSLSIGYDYSGTSYQRFSEYDLDLHHAMAEVAFNGRHFDAAITADRYEGVLDGEGYLTLTQTSPNVSKLFGSHVYMRGAYIDSSKKYDELSSRNADSSAVRLDTYFLLDGMNRYISVGLQKTAEDAVDLELDFDGLQAAIAYGHNLKLPLMRLQLKAQLRYEERDYLNVTESIAARRNDKRLRSSLTAAVPFTDHIKLEGSVEHSDNTSNLDSAVIDKMVYGLGLSVKF